MIDLNLLRKKSDFVVKNYLKRGYNYDFNYFNDRDLKIKQLKFDVYKLRSECNKKSKLYLSLLNNNVNVSEADVNCKIRLTDEIKLLKNELLTKQNELRLLESEFKEYLFSLPNLLHESVSFGLSSDDNVEIRRHDSIIEKAVIDCDLNNDIFDCIDFLSSAELSGNGFVVLKDKVAQLHRALGNYMLDVHINDHGYKEIYSPLLVNKRSFYFTGHFPKFYDDQFKIEGLDLWLIPTAEVVLSNLVSSKILSIDSLPLKYVSKTPCFRKEKGTYGKKVQGLIRQHQFDKVELVQVVEPCKSYIALDELVFNAERILKDLGFSYRIICLCSRDTGFASSKTYDLEVWFNKKKTYIEVSSCSNTESFQSRRMNAKYKNLKSGVCDYVHILNGSGVAIGRVLAAIVDNYLDNFGRIIVPDVLVKYMNGIKIL